MYPKNIFSESRPFRLQIGMIISLTLVLLAFEWKYYGKQELAGFMTDNSSLEDSIMTPITIHQPPPPPPKTTTPIIKPVDDEEEVEKIEITFLDDFDEEEEIQPLVIDEVIEDEPEDDETIHVFGVELPAEPIGGLAQFYKEIGKALKYPKKARRMNIQGRVFIQFVVEKDGSFTQIQVLRGIGAGCDEEALRVMQNVQKWKPAKQRGRAVRQRMVIPIIFKLK